MRGPRLIVAASLLLGALAFPLSTARADALVVVVVRAADGHPVDGQVTLTPPAGEGRTYTCTTDGGTCRINDVPGGRYVARFHPSESRIWAPELVVIPPDGRVELQINQRPGP
jgi:hypothetical protein